MYFELIYLIRTIWSSIGNLYPYRRMYLFNLEVQITNPKHVILEERMSWGEKLDTSWKYYQLSYLVHKKKINKNLVLILAMQLLVQGFL